MKTAKEKDKCGSTPFYGNPIVQSIYEMEELARLRKIEALTKEIRKFVGTTNHDCQRHYDLWNQVEELWKLARP